jgi:hypothetical protein
MADESKIGTDWQNDELDAIVADYFAMLAADLSRQPYVKSRHRNYQNAIFEAIDRYLTKHPEILESVPTSPVAPQVSSEIFVAPPRLEAAGERIPERLQRLVRKFDPVERDHRNRSLGKAGEEFCC